MQYYKGPVKDYKSPNNYSFRVVLICVSDVKGGEDVPQRSGGMKRKAEPGTSDRLYAGRFFYNLKIIFF